MKRPALTLILASALLVLAASCSKESTKLIFANQEKRIETFVNNTIAADETGTAHLVTNGGVKRLVLSEGEGEELASGGSVTFYYAGFLLTSTSISMSNLFATNIAEVAEKAGWSLSAEDTFEPVTEKLPGNLVNGLRKGLKGVKAGETCYIVFSGEYGFGDKQVGAIPGNSALAYYVQVTNVQN